MLSPRCPANPVARKLNPEGVLETLAELMTQQGVLTYTQSVRIPVKIATGSSLKTATGSGGKAAGQQVKALQPDSTKRAEIMQRAWQIVMKPQDYQHLTRNCEHTAYEAIEGKVKSPTVEVLLVVLVLDTADPRYRG